MIKRYEPSMQMHEDSNGEFVAYEDYAALQQKLDAMAAENAALKDLQPTQQMITAAHRELEEYDNIQIDDDAVVFTWQAMRGQQKTPATDAYLNSVRADAVEVFTSDVVLKMRESGAGAYDYADIVEAQGQELVLSLRSGTHDTADKAG